MSLRKNIVLFSVTCVSLYIWYQGVLSHKWVPSRVVGNCTIIGIIYEDYEYSQVLVQYKTDLDIIKFEKMSYYCYDSKVIENIGKNISCYGSNMDEATSNISICKKYKSRLITTEQPHIYESIAIICALPGLIYFITNILFWMSNNCHL